jgi:hypothetical protein
MGQLSPRRAREALPKRINEHLKKADELVN